MSLDPKLTPKKFKRITEIQDLYKLIHELDIRAEALVEVDKILKKRRRLNRAQGYKP